MELKIQTALRIRFFTKKNKKTFKEILNCKYLYLLLLPLLLDIIIFRYVPLYGLQIAFKDYNIVQGINASSWVGFDNFISFFQSPYFWPLLSNTLLISGYLIIFGFPAPIILALILNEVKSKMFKGLVQTVSYLPHFIASVVVVGMVVGFLAPETGIVNNLLEKLGFGSVYFLANPKYFRTIYVCMSLWKSVGFSAIIYIAAIASINMELYEAACLDGAGRFRRLWHITLPGIKPTIIILFILRLGGILDVDWQEILLLANPLTKGVSDVLQTFVYERGLIDADFSYATAVNVFKSVIGFILVLSANKISKTVSETHIF